MKGFKSTISHSEQSGTESNRNSQDCKRNFPNECNVFGRLRPVTKLAFAKESQESSAETENHQKTITETNFPCREYQTETTSTELPKKQNQFTFGAERSYHIFAPSDQFVSSNPRTKMPIFGRLKNTFAAPPMSNRSSMFGGQSQQSIFEDSSYNNLPEVSKSSAFIKTNCITAMPMYSDKSDEDCRLDNNERNRPSSFDHVMSSSGSFQNFCNNQNCQSKQSVHFSNENLKETSRSTRLSSNQCHANSTNAQQRHVFRQNEDSTDSLDNNNVSSGRPKQIFSINGNVTVINHFYKS